MMSVFSSEVFSTFFGQTPSHLLHAVPAHLSDWISAL